MILNILATALAATAVQSADELEAACLEYQEQYGASSDCSCLAEIVAGDEDLLAMFNEITSPEDVEAAPAEVQDVLEECAL